MDLVKYFQNVDGVGSIKGGLNPATWMLQVRRQQPCASAPSLLGHAAASPISQLLSLPADLQHPLAGGLSHKMTAPLGPFAHSAVVLERRSFPSHIGRLCVGWQVTTPGNAARLGVDFADYYEGSALRQ